MSRLTRIRPCIFLGQKGLGRPSTGRQQRCNLLTLAIESSCDDTSVAVLERHLVGPIRTAPGPCPRATLHYHERLTADSRQFGGVHPIVALESHQSRLAKLVEKSLSRLPDADETRSAQYSDTVCVPDGQRSRRKRKPDFVTVTRGPGMRANLAAGLELAKGLAVAWQVPLVAVNHMQAHALTPRLVSALDGDPEDEGNPSFPFFSLLVSGGHTLLVHSRSLIDHEILASTSDIAIGDALDKIGRVVLPRQVIENSDDVMYARVMEKFVFSEGCHRDNYIPPAVGQPASPRYQSRWGWSLPRPLAATRSGSKDKAMEYSFSGLRSAVDRVIEQAPHELTMDERKDLAKIAMTVAFEHLASRVVLGLEHVQQKDSTPNERVETLVLSGGVAANQYLKIIMRNYLRTKGFPDVQILSPPMQFCTDNAAMIGWTGIEMFEAGWQSDLGCLALRSWSIDPRASDGGILGVPCWSRRSNARTALKDLTN